MSYQTESGFKTLDLVLRSSIASDEHKKRSNQTQIEQQRRLNKYK